jgi:putative FmdB family regulatory protein
VPTYGYRCQECGCEFDLWQRMSDEPQAACPKCGGAGRRLFFPAGIVFKGSGFYKTDSRGSSTRSDDSAKPSGGEKASTATPTTTTGGGDT